MNQQVADSAATAPVSDSGLSIRGLWQVFVSPTELFRKLKDQPRVLVPYLVLGAALLAFMVLTGDLIMKMQMQTMEGSLQGRELPEGFQGGMKASIIGFGTLAFLLEPLIAAGLALFWGNFVFAGNVRYRQVLTVMLYGAVLYAFGLLLTLPMILAKGSIMASYSLGVLAAQAGPTSITYQLLSRIGLFHIWEWVAVGIGLSVVFNTRLSRGMTLSLLSLGVLSAFAVVMSVVGSSFS